MLLTVGFRRWEEVRKNRKEGGGERKMWRYDITSGGITDDVNCKFETTNTRLFYILCKSYLYLKVRVRMLATFAAVMAVAW